MIALLTIAVNLIGDGSSQRRSARRRRGERRERADGARRRSLERRATCASSCERRRADRRGGLARAAARRDPRASSASRAAARRRRRSRCSATPGPARGSPAARSTIDGHDAAARRRARGARRCAGRLVSYVPQDPGTALNPSLRIGDADRRHAARAPPGRAARRGDGAGARPRRPAGDARVPAPLPAPALGRPAAAGDDRDGARRAGRGWSCSTSRRRASTSSRRRASSTRSAGCATRPGWRWSTSRTTSRSSARSPTGSPSCTPAAIVEEGPTRDGAAPAAPPVHARAARRRSPTTWRRAGCAASRASRSASASGRPAAPSRRAARCAWSRLRRRACRRSSEIAPGHAVRCFEWQRRRGARGEPPPTRAVEPTRGGRAAPAVEELEAVHRSHHDRVDRRGATSRSPSRRGECLALVGESGSRQDDDRALRRRACTRRAAAGSCSTASRSRRARDGPHAASSAAACQIVFQNPYDSLNPRRRVGEQVARPPRGCCAGSGRRRRRPRRRGLLERVRLPARTRRPLPARALGRRAPARRDRPRARRAARPARLRRDHVGARRVGAGRGARAARRPARRRSGSSLLFITHDLGVVASVADRVLVLDRGRICEEGPVARGARRPVRTTTPGACSRRRRASPRHKSPLCER